MNRATHTRHRVGLHVCALEDRECPATIVAFDNNTNTLTITGDQKVNVVKVLHDDANDKLVVQYDGLSNSFASSVVQKVKVDLKGGGDRFTEALAPGTDFYIGKTVEIDTGGGRDTVMFDLAGNAIHWADLKENLALFLKTGDGADTVHLNIPSINLANSLTVYANLGNGPDRFTAHSVGNIDEAGSVKIDVRGGAGDDALSYSATYNAQSPGTGLKVVIEASLAVLFDGGAGRDRLDATFVGEVDGDSTFVLNGDFGNTDARRDLLNLHTATSAASTGHLTQFVVGQRGSDVIRHIAEGFVPAGSQLVTDGGLGTDECVNTFNVAVSNCEQ